jgi:hypothetical protein
MPSSAFFIRGWGLREVKIKYILVNLSFYMPVLEILSTGGHYLDFNGSSDKVLSKSNVPL